MDGNLKENYESAKLMMGCIKEESIVYVGVSNILVRFYFWCNFWCWPNSTLFSLKLLYPYMKPANLLITFLKDWAIT